MKATCPISGIQYKVTFPAKGETIAVHPMLAGNISTLNLINWYVGDWANGRMKPEQVHLLGLALLQKLPVESIAFPVMDTTSLWLTNKVWNANMERLARLAGKLEGRNRKFRMLSTFRLGLDTVDSLKDWITDLQIFLDDASQPITEKAKELNRASYKAITETSASTVASLLVPEQVDYMILRALNSSPLTNSESRALPVVLADWANKVTEFPSSNRTKWSRIIQIIFDQDYIGKILVSDINLLQVRALEEHLVLNTPTEAVGSTHSRLLMDRLTKVIPVIEDFSPTIVTKRRVNAGNNGVIDALLGTGQVTNQTRQDSQDKTTGDNDNTGTNQISKTSQPRMTLQEKLALRLAGGKSQ